MAIALVVDDHTENLYLLRTLLAGNGYDVVTAGDGQQALEEARRRRPDIIISDILMPVMDGFALCRAWKQDQALRGVPFVFYTATYTDPRDEALALSVGADLFLVKPTEPEEFLRRIGDVIERHAQGRLARRQAAPIEETAYLREYNETLIRKLEDKVTDLEEANRALRVKDFAFQSATRGLAILDLDGRITSFNHAFTALVGLTREAVAGQRFEALFPPSARIGDIRESIERACAWTGEINVGDFLEGGSRTLEGALDLVRDATGEPICWVLSFTDVTERRRVLEELQRAQRLQSLSLFASGIAHDVNNLLAGLFGNVELAHAALDPDSPALAYLANVNRAFDRARDLTHRLLTFAKGAPPAASPHDTVDLVRECCALSLSGSHVRWEVTGDAGVAPVLGDANQLWHAFTNIVVNARQAMPSGGTVRVSAKNRQAAAGAIAGLPVGAYVEITIADEGQGLPASALPHVFDPFFTTKPGGSGLGLAVAYSIVKSHGGEIAAASSPGGGATFTVWLPAAQKTAGAEPKPGRIPPAPLTGRVLIMDDERIICETAAAMLRQHGYQVATVADGAEAVETYTEALKSGAAFDAVILDMTVPGGMGGEETLALLTRIDPHAAVILSSGYGPEVEMRGDFRPRAILPKPYQRHELLGCVSAVVSASRAVSGR